MHYSYGILVWWIFWIFLLVWIFANRWDIPGQRTNRETPIEIFKKRFARGEITKKRISGHEKQVEIN
jgi:putative membrane protein